MLGEVFALICADFFDKDLHSSIRIESNPHVRVQPGTFSETSSRFLHLGTRFVLQDRNNHHHHSRRLRHGIPHGGTEGTEERVLTLRELKLANGIDESASVGRLLHGIPHGGAKGTEDVS